MMIVIAFGLAFSILISIVSRTPNYCCHSTTMYQCISDCMCSKKEHTNVNTWTARSISQSLKCVQARLFLHFIFNSSLNISLKSFCFNWRAAVCLLLSPFFLNQLMRILIFNGLEPVDSINCLLKDFLHFTAPRFSFHFIIINWAYLSACACWMKKKAKRRNKQIVYKSYCRCFPNVN